MQSAENSPKDDGYVAEIQQQQNSFSYKSFHFMLTQAAVVTR